MLACLAPAVAAGEIYKCRNPRGEIRFQDRPCAAGSTSTLVKQDEPGVQTPAEPVGRRSVALRPAPVHVPPGQTYVVDTSLLGTDEWKKAMNRAHMIPAVRTGSARCTLLRVWLDTVKAGESIQAAGGKLRILDQDSGGSRYQEFQSGSFVILEHLGSTARRGNHDSLEVGPITVGGSYGTRFDCESAERCVAGPLAPGSYWLLFPEFDPVNSRSKFTIEPGSQTRLQFRSISNKVIQRVRGTRPTAPASSS